MSATKQFRAVLAVVVAVLAVAGLGISTASAAERAAVGRDVAVTQPSAQLAASGLVAIDCPPGWVSRPPGSNPALGPCMPGTIVPVPTFRPSIECPPGWVSRPPELNPALGPCIPGTITSGSFELVPA